MTWPTGPPPMPPSGWYDDPDQAWTWRYWDGARWTEHRAPMWVPPVRDQRSFSAWFERSVSAVKLAVRRVGLLIVLMWLLLGALGSGLVVATFDSDRGRELRRLLDIDQTIFDPTRSSGTVELTSAEAERAWELMQGLFWSALPWLVVLGLALVIASAGSVALVARAVRHGVAVPADPVEESRDVASIAGDAVRRVPAVLASGILVFLVFAGVWLLAALPVAFVAIAGGGGAAIVLTVVFVVLALAVVMAWLWGRLALAPVLAAAGGHGLGVRRSWDLTLGRFWFVVVRLLVAGLIASVASGAANFFNTFGQIFDFSVYLAIVFLLQAVAIAVSTIITVCGHIVTIDQISDAHELGH